MKEHINTLKRLYLKLYTIQTLEYKLVNITEKYDLNKQCFKIVSERKI